jgi:hypothetical protein
VPHAPAHLARSAPLLAGLLVALALTAAPARALDLEIAVPHVRADRVWIDVRVGDLFAPRVQESLGRGMPATLQISAEVWRHRTGWFDRMTGSFATGIKIQYDVWTRTYRLEGQPIPDLAVSTIDSVRLVLSRPMELPLIRRDRLGESGRFYVVVSATLKPLSVEDVEEGEGWLSGEVVEKKHAGWGVFTAVPRSVFDAVRNFAGLGDQQVRSITDDFEPQDLVTR